MDIVRKVRAVEKLFKSLDKDIEKLKSKTGIHCISNCVKCCTTSNIVATSLEFYPLAYYLYKEGLAEQFLERISNTNNATVCPVLNYMTIESTQLGCQHYQHRGLICRLFAYNHTTNKFGVRRISACKPIQIHQSKEVELANEILSRKVIGPKASNYYSRMQFIDFHLAQELHPIGDAIRIALETIITYYYYRPKRVS